MSAADRAYAERRAQGLPERVEDPATLARVATLILYGVKALTGIGADHDAA
jgi:hypothetical protein